jgi:Fe-S-cluster-containing dehydrogenase component
MDRLMLDGNAIAGLLQEVFEVEMTTVVGTCGTCGTARPIGAAYVFRGAGTVIRCSHCKNVVGRIVTRESVACVDLSGLRAMEAAT